MKLSDILFKTKSKEIKLCPGFKSNTLAPASTKRSPRRASVSATPKLSKLCCDLENVFSKKVSVAYGSNWMYCEIQTKESIVPYFILDNTLYLQVSQPYHSISMPFFLMALNTSQKEFHDVYKSWYSSERCIASSQLLRKGEISQFFRNLTLHNVSS